METFYFKIIYSKFHYQFKSHSEANTGRLKCFLKTRKILLDKNMTKLKVKTLVLHKIKVSNQSLLE